MRTCFLMPVLLAGFFVSGALYAEEIPASADTKLNFQNPNTPGGDRGWLRVRMNTQVALLNFDVSGISSPVSATLRVAVQSVAGEGPVSVHRILGPWDELTVTANTIPSVDPTPIATQEITSGAVSGWVAFDISSLMESWLEDSTGAYGLALFADSSSVDVTFLSRETAKGPLIEVSQIAASPNTISSCTEISKPGAYKLVRNIDLDEFDSTCIRIATDDVSIDLSGFVLRGAGPYSSTAAIGGTPGHNIKIANGTITNFTDGIVLRETENVGISSMNFTDNESGAWIGPGGSVRNSEFTRSTDMGVALRTGRGSIVQGCIFSRNNIAAQIGPGSVVANNLAKDSNEDGISVGEKSTVVGNTIVDTTDEGLEVGAFSNVFNNNAYGNDGLADLVITCPTNVVGNSVGSMSALNETLCKFSNNLILNE